MKLGSLLETLPPLIDMLCPGLSVFLNALLDICTEVSLINPNSASSWRILKLLRVKTENPFSPEWRSLEE